MSKKSSTLHNPKFYSKLMDNSKNVSQ